MKSRLKMLSPGIAEIKQVYWKVVKRKIQSTLICSQSKALSSVAFVNFLYVHWSHIYHFGPFLHGNNSISSPHWTREGAHWTEKRQSMMLILPAPNCAPFSLAAPNKAVVLQKPKGCVHTHPATLHPSCLRRMGAGSPPALGMQTCHGERPPVQEGKGLLSVLAGTRASYHVHHEEGGAVFVPLTYNMWHAFSASGELPKPSKNVAIAWGIIGESWNNLYSNNLYRVTFSLGQEMANYDPDTKHSHPDSFINHLLISLQWQSWVIVTQTTRLQSLNYWLSGLL